MYKRKTKATLLIAIFILSTLALAIPLVISAGNKVLTTYPTLGATGVAAEATWATWDTDSGTEVPDAHTDGDGGLLYGVKLDTGTPTGSGDEGRIVIQMIEGFTLSDLDTISWWIWVVEGSTMSVDIILDLDEDGVYERTLPNAPDDALVIQYAYNGMAHYDEGAGTGDYGVIHGAWFKTFDDDGDGPAVITSTTSAWATLGSPGPPLWNEGTLAEWEAGITYTAADQAEKTINADSHVLRLEFEVDNWGDKSVAYIDDIEINGDIYDFEPSIALNYLDYKIDDTPILTVFDIGLNTRILIKDSGEFIAASAIDQITVDLLETGFYTSVFEGTFTLVDEVPGANELRTGHANQTTASYDREGAIIAIQVQSLVDAQLPVMTDLNPGKDANTTDATPIVEVTVTDTSGIEMAWMTLDGIVRDSDTGSGPITLDYTVLEVDPLTEGLHEVFVYATDIAGNTNQTSWTFTVDITDPTGEITKNVTSPLNAIAVEFLFTFNEDMRSSPEPTIDGNATTYMTAVTDGQDWIDARTYSANYTVNSETAFNGSVLMDISEAVDMAGNEMVAANRTFYIDTEDPTAPGSLASTAGVNSVTLTWTASSDLGSGMASYNIYKGDALLGNVPHPTLTYTDSGLTASATLDYIVEAVDLAGNEYNSSELEVEFVLGDVTEWNISLVSGWNLISLPLIPDNTSISAVLADVLTDVDKVWSYVESTGTWLSYVPGGPPSLTTMEDGEGYWIEMSDNVTLTVHGVEMPAPPALPPTYSLVAGWNLIGFKSLEAMNASSYLGTSVAADTIRIYGYADETYTGVALGANLNPGMGYWIAMDDTGTIYP